MRTAGSRRCGAGHRRKHRPAGHVEVNPDLTLPGHPEISVIGDAAKLAGEDGKPLPGLATVAIQQARHVAEAIRHGEPGASKPFQYFDKGALAVVGRGRAVCEVRGHRLSGLIAFLMYVGVHLFYLGGVGGRRFTVLFSSIGSIFGARESRVMGGELEPVERAVPNEARRGPTRLRDERLMLEGMSPWPTSQPAGSSLPPASITSFSSR